jgi:hypothetical protein
LADVWFLPRVDQQIIRSAAGRRRPRCSAGSWRPSAGPDGVREPRRHHSNGTDVPTKRQASLGWAIHASSGRDVRFIAPPPPRSVRAAFPHTACMGLSLSRVAHTIFRTLFLLLFCSTRAASILPPRLHFAVAAARSEGQGRRFFSPAGSSLTNASTAANCRDRVVCHAMTRGEPAIGHERLPRTTLVFG